MPNKLRAIVFLLCLGFVSLAYAADWPTRPIRLIHGFTAGGNVDITARIVAQVLSEGFGQPVIVDGRPGAGGTVAAGIVAKSEPDGYTLFMMASGHSISPGLYRSLPYDPVNDFTMVSLVSSFPFVIQSGKLRPLAITSTQRWKNWPDVPTVAETVSPGYEVKGWLALAGPKGMPGPVVTRLAQALHKGLARPEVIERFRQMGTGAAPSEPAETQKFLAAEVARWLKVVRDEKIPYQD